MGRGGRRDSLAAAVEVEVDGAAWESVHSVAAATMVSSRSLLASFSDDGAPLPVLRWARREPGDPAASSDRAQQLGGGVVEARDDSFGRTAGGCLVSSGKAWQAFPVAVLA